MADATRLGQILLLEREIASIEAQLKAFAAQISDSLFAMSSHLDTNGKLALELAKKYHELQCRGIALFKRLQELQPE